MQKLWRNYFVVLVIFLGLFYVGCEAPWYKGAGVEGYLAIQQGVPAGGATVYVLPLLRYNRPAYYVLSDGGGHYHHEHLKEGWWILATAHNKGLAWSEPFYYFYDEDTQEGDELMRVDIQSPYIPIDGDVSSTDLTRGHMLVAANIPDGSNQTDGIFLITRDGWQEVFPVFNDDNWVYGKPSYNKATPGEIVFAAGVPGEKDIFRFQMFTGEIYNLTNSPGVDENDPTYSPDGQEVVYTADALVDPYGYEEIWVMARDGSGRFCLMSDYIDIGGGIFEYHDCETPTWTDENLVGSQWGAIAFSVSPLSEANYSIAVCSRDLQDVFWRLTPYTEDDKVPTIHPSSTVARATIVYTKSYETSPGNYELDLYNLTAANIEGPGASVAEWALSGYDFSQYDELYPSFNKSGNRLAFVSTNGNQDETYGALYSRNTGSADSLSSLEQWTVANYGDIYVGPTILGQ